jgi:hypothetical protein
MSAKPAESQTSELLQEYEYRALYTLCYKKEDVAAMEPAVARQRIAKRLYKPGSAKAIAQNAAQAGMPASAVPIDKMTDEAIEERNAGKDAPVEMLVSDWYNKNSESCAEGQGTLFDKVVAPIMREFPELAFRWMDEGVNARLGTDLYERFYHPRTGKDFVVGNLYLGYKPIEVKERAEREAAEFNQAQFRSVTSEVRANNKNLQDQNYGGAYKDSVRLTRDDGKVQQL